MSTLEPPPTSSTLTLSWQQRAVSRLLEFPSFSKLPAIPAIQKQKRTYTYLSTGHISVRTVRTIAPDPYTWEVPRYFTAPLTLPGGC